MGASGVAYLLPVNCDQSVQRAQACSMASTLARVHILSDPARPTSVSARRKLASRSSKRPGNAARGLVEETGHGLSRACAQGHACRVRTALGPPREMIPSLASRASRGQSVSIEPRIKILLGDPWPPSCRKPQCVERALVFSKVNRFGSIANYPSSHQPAQQIGLGLVSVVFDEIQLRLTKCFFDGHSGL